MTRHHRREYADWTARMSEFEVGAPVIYRASQERGIVSSKSDQYVFVQFSWSQNGVACHPDDLEFPNEQ